ncbi:hypothetical protein JB92DRAFT_3209976 [Gautieria morchelliformis]|nr:hypothetical protein JB92DRAFT_3209976 [Gautieria morchelliformis]
MTSGGIKGEGAGFEPASAAQVSDTQPRWSHCTTAPPGSGVNVGEMRLQSDFLIARDPCTACTWQGFVNEQDKMSTAFRDAMAKLGVIGQNPSQSVDCSEVILDPIPASGKPVTYVSKHPRVQGARWTYGRGNWRVGVCIPRRVRPDAAVDHETCQEARAPRPQGAVVYASLTRPWMVT